MNFKELNLHPKLLDALERQGLTTPTPVQEQAIPVVAIGKDVQVSAQTGTGKTAAFVLPALHKLATVPRKGAARGPRVLILTPTRELATQVAQEVVKFSANLPELKTVTIYGGVPYGIQNRQLSRPFDILVATPGRLIDQLDRGNINLKDVEMLILDEADRMLDMGFVDPVIHIAKLTSPQRQTLLFSATLKGSVLKLSQQLLKDPQRIEIGPTAIEKLQITEHFQAVDGLEHKHRLLKEILDKPEMNQAIVFTATKRQAEKLADQLSEEGYDTSALHGDMRQRQRDKTIKLLRYGKVKILVATDVAARGIDLDSVTHVVNFDLPGSAEDYVHRIGRTGRAGRTGSAFSFANRRDRSVLVEIEKYTGQVIPLFKEKGSFEPSSRPPGRGFAGKKKHFFPKKQGGGGGGGNRKKSYPSW